MPTIARHRALRRPLAALVAVGALAGGVSACGVASSSSGAGPDLAGAVPPAAPVYLEVTLGGGGEQSANLDALARRVLRTDDPAAKVRALVDRAGRTAGLTWKDDVEPWLGDRAAIAVTAGAGAERPDTLAVLSSTDDAAASDALAPLAGGDARDTAYRDVEVREGRDSAAAVLDGRVLVGAPRAVRAAIDAAKGDSLAETGRFARARDDAGAGGIGFAFLDVRQLFRLASARAGAAAIVLAPLADALPEHVGARLRAERDAFVLDAAAPGGAQTASLLAGRGAADAVAQLPGDAWLAVGIADLGRTLTSLLDTVGSSGLGALGVRQVEERVRQATGLSLRTELLSWMGSGAVFVAGARPDELGGGLVLRSTDPAASARAVRSLGGLLRSSAGGARVHALRASGVDAGWVVSKPGGRRIVLAAAGEKVVVAAGRRALEQVLRPRSELGEAPAFEGAAAGLGGGLRPSFFLDVPAVMRLAGQMPGSDPHGAELREYLAAFGPVVAGARRDGDTMRARLRVPVR